LPTLRTHDQLHSAFGYDQRLSVWRCRSSDRGGVSSPSDSDEYLARADIFIAHTSIMPVLWLNWKLLGRRCPTTLAYSS
jgi:hypothetical protein